MPCSRVSGATILSRLSPNYHYHEESHFFLPCPHFRAGNLGIWPGNINVNFFHSFKADIVQVMGPNLEVATPYSIFLPHSL